MEYLHTSFLNKEDARTHRIQFYNAVFLSDMFVAQRGSNHGHELIISFETKFWILEQNVEVLLEALKQVIFDNFNFHVFWDLLIKLIIFQESIRTLLKIIQSI